MSVMKPMTHGATAYAQIILSLAFMGGYFGVLFMILSGMVKIPADLKDLISNLLSVITGGVLLILNYWFSRQRESSGEASSGQPQ